MRPTTKGMNIRADQMVAPVRLLVLVHKQASAAADSLHVKKLFVVMVVVTPMVL